MTRRRTLDPLDQLASRVLPILLSYHLSDLQRAAGPGAQVSEADWQHTLDAAADDALRMARTYMERKEAADAPHQ